MESATSFSLTLYGELLSSIHTAFSIIGNILILLFKGKGNDKGLFTISTENLEVLPIDAKASSSDNVKGVERGMEMEEQV
jgi:hypothetical protein